MNGNLENEQVVGRPANAAGISPLALATSIQSNGTTLQGYFAGRLDEARVWNYARTQAEIQTSMNSEILTPAVGLMGRWGLNDASGTTAANLNRLGLTSFTLEAWVKRAAGGATMSTGTNGLDGTSPRPLAYPVLTKGMGEGESPANINTNWFLGITSTGMIGADFEDTAGGVNRPAWGTTNIPIGEWHHIAATYTGSCWALYLDGNPETLNTNVTACPNATPEASSYQRAALSAGINSTGGPGAGYFSGAIDEARVWNRPLTAAEIQANKNLELTSGTGLVARWGMNENSGTVISSSIGTFPGTLVNGPTWVLRSMDITPPAVPTNLMASARPGAVQMEWTANTETDLAGYNIYRSTTSPVIKDTRVNSTIQTSPSYLDEGVTSGTTYYYAVTALDTANNESALSNEASAVPLPPLPAEALKLGSGQAYVKLGDNADTATFTLETWLRRDGNGTSISTGTGGTMLEPVIANGTAEAETAAADINYIFGINADSKLCADFEEAQNGAAPSQNHPACGSTALTMGAWYHAAVTYDGATWKIYLNGNLDGQMAVGQPANAANTSQLAFGTSMNTANAASGFFNGTLDEVRIWNYARTQAQIAGMVNAKITEPQTGLIGRWGMDDGSGTSLGDTSGNNITGAITGTGYTWVIGSPFNAAVNLPPDEPVLVAPANSATNVSTDTNLSVNVSDPEGQPLNVTFYGRPLQSAAGPDFTLAIIPDAQYYASTYPAIYNAQMNWVASSKTTNNIVYLASLGDSVDSASTLAQWTNADTAYDILDAAGVPYGVSAGNHDGAPSGTGNFNTYFGTSRFNAKPYYGGYYGSDNDNHYDLFEASGQKFIVVFIEYDDTMTSTAHPVLQWANGLLQTYLDRRAIVISHNMLLGGISTDFSTQGQTIYNALKGNANLFLILGGHLDVASRRTDTDSGHTIYTLRSDYQSVDSQQSGYLRIMRFSPADDMIYVRTYSPTQNKDYDKSDAAQNNFSLPYAMQGVGFQAIGTASGVPSGGTAAIPWSGLSSSSQYEWFAIATDGTHQTSSSTWNFTTAGLNNAPVCNPASLETAEDTPGSISLSCADADGDPLAYTILSGPAHGTLSGTGANLTYTPALNANGPDTFTFSANDGKADSNVATASIMVTPVNDAPVCNPASLTTAEDTPGSVSLNCSDVEGDSLTYSVTSPMNGTTSLNGADLTYTPNANFFGSDNLSFKANDGAADSPVSTVNITVTPVNDAPVCQNVSITTNQGVAGETVANCADVDNTSLTYSIVTNPQHGTAAVDNSTLSYTGGTDFSGTDSFTYQASDGSLLSNIAGVAVTVNAVNTAPFITLQPANQTVKAGETVLFTAQAGGNPTPAVEWFASPDGGSTWTKIDGAASNTYSFTAQASDHGSQYRAVFTNIAGSATTDAATLSINIAPAITTQPVDTTVIAGNAAQFTAAASGRPSPAVQWESSPDGNTWTPVTGAASETYAFATQATDNGKQYRAVFTNAAGTATTSAATLTVNYAPAITSQPAGQTVIAGQTASFSAAASGNPAPTVQWSVSADNGATWNEITDAFSATYRFTAQVGDNGKQYRATFTNSVASISTNPAALTIQYPPAAPANLTATAAPVKQIDLAWTDASDNEANFMVERSTTGSNGPFNPLATLNAGVTTYSDTGLAYASEYCYRARATNATGDSDYSNVACATTEPEPNNALALGAAHAFVALGDNVDLPQFTLETWLRRDGAGVATTTGTGGKDLIPLITNGTAEAENANADINYFLGIQGADSVLCADFEEAQTGTTPGLNHPVCGTTPLATGAWYHAAVTYDGATWRLYLNGNPEAALAVNQPVNTANISQLAFGTSMKTDNTALGFFDGALDEVRIWDYARTQAEIAGAINTAIHTPQSGLVGRWGFNEGTGTVISSSAGTAIDGTITGSGANWVQGAPFNLNFNHAPIEPVLVSPANGATGVGTDATLSVTASDPDNDPLSVTFYGRPTTGPSGPDFTLVALPDTQNYTTLTGGDATFNAETQWIVDNQTSQNIVFTTHLGDITESGGNDTTGTQWQIANTAMSKLEKGTSTPDDDVPFGVVPGNHDVAGGTALFETYFGVSRFDGRPYYGGHYGSDNLNSYAVFNASGVSFIVLNLQCTGTTPAAAVLDWADGLLKADLNRRGIVACHTLFATTTALSTEGTAVFNALSDNPNLFLMLGGHVSGVGRLALQGTDGHTINLLLADFQSEANGGNGWLRILKFSPANNQIQVTTYSPTLGQYKTDSANQFTLNYTMAGSSFSQIGTASAASGETVNVTWAGLNPGAQYEWYASVSDANATTSGQTWNFTTSSDSLPSITTQPADQTVTAGQNVSFSAAADGQPAPTAQWQVSTDNGSTWNNITGATSTTYTLTAQAADNLKQYRAIFANSVGSAATSAATLTVQFVPEITTQPANQTVNAAQRATFSAAASGNPAPTVQWQVSVDHGGAWTDLSGATSTLYSFTAEAADDGKQFRAVFSNSIGAAVISNAATLTVNTAPVITAHPQAITIVAGQAASFSAAAIGNPLPTVQWQVSTNNGKAWKNISGATSTQYSFTAQATDSGKQFRAIFTNSLGTATTNAAKLTITASTAPVITTQPADQSVADSQTASFTAAASGNPTPTVQWQVSTDNGATWTIISGAASGTYSFTTQASDNGKQFRAVFTNTYGTATSNAARLTVSSTSNSAPVITFQPASKSVKAGTQVSFSAAASGNPAPTVQWQVSTNKGRTWTDIIGATNPSYSLIAQRTVSGNQYRAVFTNDYGAATTNAATLTVR